MAPTNALSATGTEDGHVNTCTNCGEVGCSGEIHGHHKCFICFRRFMFDSQLKDHQQAHPVTFKPKSSSLADICEAKLLTQLAALVSNKGPNSIFAIGGVIVLGSSNNTSTSLDNPGVMPTEEPSAPAETEGTAVSTRNNYNTEEHSSTEHNPPYDPVAIRWDSVAGGGHKVTLPCNDIESLKQLLQDCEPVGLGREGHEPGNLDKSAFSCNFDPYHLGIVDTIAYALFPKLAKRPDQSNGLRAEVSNLSVYSASSGKPRADPTIPQSEHQVGILVICLPATHKGGQLTVRHHGREQVFDWSGENSSQNIQWAAFTSDCEHEILNIVSGHCVMITYHLYLSHKENEAMLDTEHVEFCTTLEQFLTEPAFCKVGSLFGFHCVHAYPHTDGSMFETLHTALKGMDKIVFESFSQLGLDVKLRHELFGDVYEDYWSSGTVPPYPAHGDEYDAVRHLGDPIGERTVMAKALTPLYMTRDTSYDGTFSLGDTWGSSTVEHVVWLNRANLKQPAKMAGTMNDNGSGVAIMFSNLVITATIPPFWNRG